MRSRDRPAASAAGGLGRWECGPSWAGPGRRALGIKPWIWGSGALGSGLSRGVGDGAELTGCSSYQQKPSKCHLGHQGEPVKQRGQEHPEHPGH